MPAQSPVLFFEYKLAYSVGAVTLYSFHFFSSKQPNAPSMAMRKIGVGTLVSVEQESTGRGRRRPSEGGIGFVVKRKKQRCMEDKNGETPVVELTQQSTTSTTTAGTGATMFDIRYSLDGHLSQEVNKNRVRVGMLGTTARQRNGSREVRPSLLMASTTTTTNNNNNKTTTTLHTTTEDQLASRSTLISDFLLLWITRQGTVSKNTLRCYSTRREPSLKGGCDGWKLTRWKHTNIFQRLRRRRQWTFYLPASLMIRRSHWLLSLGVSTQLQCNASTKKCCNHPRLQWLERRGQMLAII